MNKEQNANQYSPEEYRKFINFLLDKIDDTKLLHRILAIVNRIYCEN